MNNNCFDVVIIGSGLGGFLCGLILSKAGYSVCIVEKHNQPGGNTQTFKRKSCTFSTGMHYAGSLEDGQLLNKVFKYLNILDKIKLKKLNEKCFEKIFIENDQYCYPMGFENFKNSLINYFPSEKQAIIKYTEKLKTIWDNVDILNLRPVKASDFMNFGHINENAYHYIESLSKNKKLKALLAATNGLYAGDKNKTPMYIHGIINAFFINSAWKIDEGKAGLTSALKSQFENFGGTILTKKEVSRIVCNEKKATAVTTTDGDTIYGNHFISNIHPYNTVKIADKNLLRKVYIKRLENLENSISCFGLYIVLKKNALKHINSNIYYSSTTDVWGVNSYDPKNWPKGFICYTTPDQNNDKYAESATAITYMKYDEVKKWEDTYIGNRGDDYKSFKNQKASKFIDAIEKVIPGIKNCIDEFYTSSPLTYRDYTGTPDGSMYGVVKDCNNPITTFLSHNTKIPNLYLTGQNLNLHGILGVTISSIISCSNLVNINDLIKDIKNA